MGMKGVTKVARRKLRVSEIGEDIREGYIIIDGKTREFVDYIGVDGDIRSIVLPKDIMPMELRMRIREKCNDYKVWYDQPLSFEYYLKVLEKLNAINPEELL